MKATCRIGALDKSLWVSFADTPIILRIMLPGAPKLPAEIQSLRNAVIDFDDLRRRVLVSIPTNFKRTVQSKTSIELVAINASWTLSVMHSRTSADRQARIELLQEAETWISENLQSPDGELAC